MCCDHQQPHPARLHRWQGLREDMGHQPARQQESHLPAGLLGESPRAMGIFCSMEESRVDLAMGEDTRPMARLSSGLAEQLWVS